MALLRPIQGETALKFWSSANVCNRVRAICAYSLDAEDANKNLERYGYPNSFRKRVLKSSGVEFNNPLMTGIGFNNGNTPIWDCLDGKGGVTPVNPPVITLQPKNVTVNEGETVTFTANADDYDSVKWQVDGVDIPSATSTTYTFKSTLTDSGKKYNAVFTNSAGSSTTNSATLTVNAIVLGSINFDPTKPEDVVIDKLGPVKLTAVANPTGLDGEPTYSWTCSEDGTNWGGCVGSGSNSLEYYLSIAETPAKGETKYFKCIGNGTSGGVAIPQEETRVVSVTHESAKEFSADITNTTHNQDEFGYDDIYSVQVTPGDLDGTPFELTSDTTASIVYKREGLPDAPLSRYVKYDTSTSSFPNIKADRGSNLRLNSKQEIAINIREGYGRTKEDKMAIPKSGREYTGNYHTVTVVHRVGDTFLADIENKTHTDGTVEVGDVFGVDITQGILDGNQVDLTGYKASLVSDFGLMISGSVDYNTNTSSFPDLKVTSLMASPGNVTKISIRLTGSGGFSLPDIWPEHYYTVGGAREWVDSEDWVDSDSWTE